jgi:hypothetical protein
VRATRDSISSVGRGGVGLHVLACALGLFAAACVEEPPQVAAGFQLKKMSGVSVGLSRTDVVSIVGAPVREVTSESSPGRTMLVYAMPGAVWIDGEYKTKVSGYECLVWLQGDRVVSARIMQPQAGLMCSCDEKACPTNWSDACLPRRSK